MSSRAGFETLDWTDHATGESWPLVEAAGFTRVNRAPSAIRLIVLHTTEGAGPGKPGDAMAVARWFAGKSSTPPQASAHVICDPGGVVRCVEPQHVAWGAPGANGDGFHIEQFGRALSSKAGPAFTAEDWGSEASQATLRFSAAVCARVTKLCGIPLRIGGVDEVRDPSWRGIVGHRSVSLAFKKSDHSDPGVAFPWQAYLRLVQQEFQDA